MRKVQNLPTSYFWLLLGLIFLVTWLVYRAGFSGPFLLDDMGNIQPVERLAHPDVSMLEIALSNPSGTIPRIVPMVTFGFNWYQGGFDTYYFKLTNFVLHLLCGLMVFVVSRRLLSFKLDQQVSLWLAGLTTAFWLLSPLFVSTVLYVVQRMAQLSTLFTLASIWAYLEWRYTSQQGNHSNLKTGVFSLVFLGAFILGLFSKENTLLLFPLLLVCEVWFVSSLRQLMSNRPLSAFFFLSVIFPVIVVTIMLISGKGLSFSYVGRDFTLYERLLTESRILWEYVYSLLLPNGANFGLYHDDFVISRSLFSPATTVYAVFGWILVIFGSLFSLLKNKFVVLTGGVVFFLVGHSMESTVLPLELYFEHRNYLPAVGLYLSTSIALWMIAQQLRSRMRVILAGSLALLLTGFSFATAQRAAVWSNYEAIIRTSLAAHPNSPRINLNMILIEVEAGNLEKANYHIKRATELQPEKALTFKIIGMFSSCIVGEQIVSPDVAVLPKVLSMREFKGIGSPLEKLRNRTVRTGCGNFDVRAAYLDLAELAKSSMAKATPAQIRPQWLPLVRISEGLLLFGAAPTVIQILDGVRAAGIDMFHVDLVWTIANIEVGNFEIAQKSLQAIKLEDSVDHRVHKPQIEQVEQLLLLRMNNEKI